MKIKKSFHLPNVKFVSTLLGLSLLTGCQTAYVGNPSWPTLSHQEADAFRQSLIDAHKKQPLSPKQETVYVQPLNKKEKCLVPFAPELAKKKGLKSYWDGQCKNGYAFGLGRDVVIAKDGTHIEEISVYDENHQNYGPYVWFDYKQNMIIRGLRSLENSNKNKISAIFSNDSSQKKNNISQQIIKAYGPCAIDKKQYTCAITRVLYSTAKSLSCEEYFIPLTTDKLFKHMEEGVIYQLHDMSARPKANLNSPISYISILNQNLQPGGVILVNVNNERLVPLMATTKQPVNVPKTYTKAIIDKLAKAATLTMSARDSYVPANQLLNTYLGNVCDNPNLKVPNGMSRSSYLKICSYEKQMDKKVEKAVPVAYKIRQKEKEQAEKSLAIEVQKYREEQEHQAKLAAYRAQVKAAESLEREAAYASLSRAFDNINKSSQQATNNAYSMMNSMSIPSPTPLTPNRSSEIYMVRPLSDHVTSVRQLY